jgi:hypothetical protein
VIEVIENLDEERSELNDILSLSVSKFRDEVRMIWIIHSVVASVDVGWMVLPPTKTQEPDELERLHLVAYSKFSSPTCLANPGATPNHSRTLNKPKNQHSSEVSTLIFGYHRHNQQGLPVTPRTSSSEHFEGLPPDFKVRLLGDKYFIDR